MKPLLIVVDDDPDDIEFFSIALASVNPDCDFKYFFNGIEFLDFYKHSDHKQPTAVAIDINMPMLSGLELLNLLKENKVNLHTPIYVITTAKPEQHKKDCMALGAKGFYTKPVAAVEWREIVKDILKGLEESTPVSGLESPIT